MWEEKLEKVINLKKEFGDVINPGLSNREMNKWLDDCKTEINQEIPEEYLKLLTLTNGIEFDGCILYGVDSKYLSNQEYRVNGLISNNLDWKDLSLDDDYLFLGDNDISWFAYDSNKNQYLILDKPSARVMEIFDSCDLFLDRVLSKML